MSAAAPRQIGDPSAPWWTYADIAARVGLGVRTLQERMPEWERCGFPAPLPYSKREKRWHTPAALAWLERFETAHHARAVQLAVIEGGRR